MKSLVLFLAIAFPTIYQTQQTPPLNQDQHSPNNYINRILKEVNDTKWQVLLPPVKNYTTPLTDHERDEIIGQIEWKNQQIRMDRKFNEVENKFLPEHEDYIQNLRNSGWPFFIMAFGVWVYIAIYLFMRLALGKCGGYNMPKPDVTKLTKATPGVLIGIGTVIFLIGIIVTFIGAQGYTNTLGYYRRTISDQSTNLSDELYYVNKSLTGINKDAYNVPNQTYLFNVTTEYLAYPINESYDMLKSASDYTTFLEEEEDVYWWFPFFFFFGVVGILILSFGWKKQLPSINFLLGLIFCILGGLAFGVSGLFFTEDIMVGDICEQCYDIVELGQMPFYGVEMGFYYSCMSSVIQSGFLVNFVQKARSQVITSKYEVMVKLNDSMQYYRAILEQNNGVNVSQQQTPQNIIDYDSNLYTTNYDLYLKAQPWSNYTRDLYKQLEIIIDIEECQQIKIMSKKCEETICLKGYPRLYQAFIGMLIVGISFLCASAGGIYSKNILAEIIEEVIFGQVVNQIIIEKIRYIQKRIELIMIKFVWQIQKLLQKQNQFYIFLQLINNRNSTIINKQPEMCCGEGICEYIDFYQWIIRKILSVCFDKANTGRRKKIIMFARILLAFINITAMIIEFLTYDEFYVCETAGGDDDGSRESWNTSGKYCESIFDQGEKEEGTPFLWQSRIGLIICAFSALSVPIVFACFGSIALWKQFDALCSHILISLVSYSMHMKSCVKYGRYYHGTFDKGILVIMAIDGILVYAEALILFKHYLSKDKSTRSWFSKYWWKSIEKEEDEKSEELNYLFILFEIILLIGITIALGFGLWFTSQFLFDGDYKNPDGKSIGLNHEQFCCDSSKPKEECSQEPFDVEGER